jgi:hypothetical protein
VILLVVMTCPRPTGAPDYLPATLEALDENGADLCDEKWISVDGDQAKHTVCTTSRESSVWDFRWNKQKTGQRLALWRTFMLAQERNADWLILCEDDLAIAPNAVDRIIEQTKTFPNDCAFLTFYSRRVPEGAAHGIHKFPSLEDDFNMYSWGSLCYLVPRRAVDYFLSCDPMRCDPFPVSFHGGDFVVSYHASKSPWPNFGVVVPCLVDHVGDYTAIPGNERVPVRGNNYAGVRDSVWHDLQRPFYETLREELKAKK